MSENKNISITVLLPAGRLPLNIMKEAQVIAEEYGLGIYLSTAQNLRLINVPEEIAADVKSRLAACGAEFKAPGKFPIPRVCIGKDHCNLGLTDPEDLSWKILARAAGREKTKAKFKIAVSACTMCCSGVKTTDIGVMATRDGYEVFTGGKGGPYPRVGRRIARKISEEDVLDIIDQLVEFHDKKTEKKQRIYKLLTDPEFPFPEV